MFVFSALLEYALVNYASRQVKLEMCNVFYFPLRSFSKRGEGLVVNYKICETDCTVEDHGAMDQTCFLADISLTLRVIIVMMGEKNRKIHNEKFS